MANVSSVVAERIIAARTAKQWSRQDLAKRLRTTYLQVYRIETGVTAVSLDAAAKYARALGVPVGFLLFGENKAAS